MSCRILLATFQSNTERYSQQIKDPYDIRSYGSFLMFTYSLTMLILPETSSTISWPTRQEHFDPLMILKL